MKAGSSDESRMKAGISEDPLKPFPSTVATFFILERQEERKQGWRKVFKKKKGGTGKTGQLVSQSEFF